MVVWIHMYGDASARADMNRLSKQILIFIKVIHYLMGDTQLWAEMALLSEVSYIPESLATYRVLARIRL